MSRCLPPAHLLACLTPPVADGRVLRALRARASFHTSLLRVVMIGTRPVALLGGVAFIAVAVGCARTEPEPASPSIAQVRQVAYLKAANPDMGDHFACGGSLPGHIGSALAIST